MDYTAADGVVVLLDALGTKGILAHQPSQQVIISWKKTISSLETAAEIARAKGALVDLISFSDTILLVVKQEGSEAIRLLEHAAMMVSEAFATSIMDGVFLRGALSFGKIIQDGTKIIGPAIEEAAQWYEQADWMGIIASPSVEWHLRRTKGSTSLLHELFVSYDATPLKGEKPQTMWVLEWFDAFRAAATIENIQPRDLLLLSFARHSGAVNRVILPKYTNTLKYIEWAEQAVVPRADPST